MSNKSPCTCRGEWDPEGGIGPFGHESDCLYRQWALHKMHEDGIKEYERKRRKAKKTAGKNIKRKAEEIKRAKKKDFELKRLKEENKKLKQKLSKYE